jgi:hypothetical protein
MSAQGVSKTDRTFSATELTEHTVYRRAIEAVIWGLPAVNYERMLQAAIADGAKAKVASRSSPVSTVRRSRCSTRRGD